MAEKLGAGVEVVYINMEPRAKIGHLEQVDNCVKSYSIATRRRRLSLVNGEVTRVTTLAVGQDKQLVASFRGLRTLGYRGLINYKVLVWVVVCPAGREEVVKKRLHAGKAIMPRLTTELVIHHSSSWVTHM